MTTHHPDEPANLATAAVARARRTGNPDDARRAAALVDAHIGPVDPMRAAGSAEATLLDRVMALWLRSGVGDGESLGEFIVSGKATREEMLAAGLTPDDLEAAGAWAREGVR